MSRPVFHAKRLAIPVALAFGLGVLTPGAGAVSAAHPPGAVYTLTNDPAGNAVKVFDRAADGSLEASGEIATGGTGTGGGLGNQSAVVIDGRHLFGVNAGSDSISSFDLRGGRLRLVDTAPSGGDQPVSITVHRDVLYVLNAGGSGSISGLEVSSRGELAPLAGSTRPLSGTGTAPAQVSFDPRGRLLAVTETHS
jgi:6-phosphogluconolactonase (cycloisomerase 2 family)